MEKILVIGAARSGLAAAKIAKKFGAEVVLSDAKLEREINFDLNELRGLGVIGLTLLQGA